MDWLNILISTAIVAVIVVCGALQRVFQRAEKRAGQSGEQEGSCFWGCVGLIGLIVLVIGAFNVWMGGIRRKAADEVLRQNPLPPIIGPHR